MFLNENLLTSIMISLKFVPKGPIDNKPALVQVMACRLMAPSHNLNQRWHFIGEVLGHSPEHKFPQVIILEKEFENYTFIISHKLILQ